MKHLGGAVGALIALAAVPLSTSGFAACRAQSGTSTAALVELYTSEGCSSCPPADRTLARLGAALDPGAVAVPLALHVDYWDAIGWKDPYALPPLSQRHQWLVHANGHKVTYTPHFFVSGSELARGSDDLRLAVRQINSHLPQAQIQLRADPAGSGALALDVAASAPSSNDGLALYVAVTENQLVSHVARGENSGATLLHDHVVRAWTGPLALAGGSAHLQQDIALPVQVNRANVDVVAFVQDRRSGAVLQAVAAESCATAVLPGAPR